MSRLAPNLFTRRFQDFVEIGRARLHALAPSWTDYNAHDPGITLMELMAWTCEAQLYSLSRMRRDERAAYAALMGIQLAGWQPATGLIWPDSLDTKSPVATYLASFVLPGYSTVTLGDTPGPVYRTLHDLLWMPGAIKSLVTHQGSSRIDHTAKNRRGNIIFYPFGQDSAAGKTLLLSFHCRDDRGLFGAGKHNALWPIGVLASPSATETSTSTGADISSHPGSRLSVALVAGGERFNVPIVADTSQAMLTTGVMLLDLSNVLTSPVDFTLEFTAPHDLVRPPRVLRIEANVIPIEQSESVDRELHVSNGLPGWSFVLDRPDLRFAPGSAPVVIQTLQPIPVTWSQRGDLSELAATDNAFEFDADSGTVTFGNGINGRVPPAETQVLASYQVTAGTAGNIARNRRWVVQGIQGPYGSNLNPLSGGADVTGLSDLQRLSRRQVHDPDSHPLITEKDIIDATLKLPLLEVGRAWILHQSLNAPSTGTTTLVAMRQRPGGNEPPDPPETALWLRSIQQSLRPRMPLGSRLIVTGPRYVTFTVNATIETQRGIDPAQVKSAVLNALTAHFQLVPSSASAHPVQAGTPVSTRDVAALIRQVPGISRIMALSLAAGAAPGKSVEVPPNGLAKLDIDHSQVTVARPVAPGGAA
jgi:hypothetical protein